MIIRRELMSVLLGLALLLALLAGAMPSARAAEDPAKYPSQPVRFVIPFAPGGTTDFVARIVQPKLQETLGKPVVVENRPGAAGNIAMEMVAKATPDGTTIMLGDVGSITINAALYPDLKVKPVTDFMPISVITHTPSLLVVGPTFAPKNVQELVAYVKERPAKVSFASQGAGSQNRLAMEVFAELAGLKMVHVPYKGGSGPAAADIMGGHVPMMFAGLPPVVNHVRGGRMRVLAMATKERHPALPEVPTFIEAGYPDMVMSSWQGIFVPVATPKPIVDKLHAAVAAVMADPEVKAKLLQGGLTGESPTPAESIKFIAAEEKRWTTVAKAVGATAD
ncbi:MAG: tripartite tricarboxylate transporter substrate binding protein [Xanthobacteraceae bacterium]|nr:tripartite tricarboxylate transporter substrate binding protein [Xanthobacteraceae bacterium]